MIFNLLQLIGGIILSVGYIPQIVKLIKTKSSKDFDIKTFVLCFVGIFLMEIYAVSLVVNGSGDMFLVTNTMSLLIQLIMVILIKKYSKL